MKLYSYYNSSASFRVRIALNLKGIKVEMIPVNLLKGEHRSAEYRAINPQMLVPTLTDNGHVLSQSLAIIEYLEEIHPGPSLLPGSPAARAEARRIAYMIACETGPLGNLKVRNYLTGELQLSKDVQRQWIQHWFAEGFSAVEKTLAESSYTGDFCMGVQPSIADCCLVPQIVTARRFDCDLSPYPHINRIVAGCEQHTAFIAARPDKQADAP